MTTYSPPPRPIPPRHQSAPTPDPRVVAAGLTHVAPQRRGVRRRVVSMLRTADRTYAKFLTAIGHNPYA